ncbi:MAG: hypothetical protein MZV70_10465 [Desulfobacterales bacterium]|nr:hypothetical protein [Desulfobacterales bacterium]
MLRLGCPVSEDAGPGARSGRGGAGHRQPARHPRDPGPLPDGHAGLHGDGGALRGGRRRGRRFSSGAATRPGLVLADHLAAAGQSVTVLHRKAHFGEEMSSNDRYYLRERLKHARRDAPQERRASSRFSRTASASAPGTGTMELRGVEGFVLADTFVSLREAANLVKPHGARIHFIGDAKQPRGT